MRRSIIFLRSLPQADKGRDSAYKLVVSNASKTSIQMPVIILVNPFSEENIGSISRTMLNFGLSELRIVSPQCDILSPKARVLAVGSIELLENAKIYDTIQDSVSDLHRVIATSGKSRAINLDIHTPNSASKICVTNSNNIENNNNDNNNRYGILFGRERGGLTSDEINSFADSILYIPAFDDYSILNLSQSVNIIGYELWKRKLQLLNDFVDEKIMKIKESDSLASKNDINQFLIRIENNLKLRNYTSKSKNNYIDSNMNNFDNIIFNNNNNKIEMDSIKGIRSIFTKIPITKSECNMLHGMLTALLRSPIDNIDRNDNIDNNSTNSRSTKE